MEPTLGTGRTTQIKEKDREKRGGDGVGGGRGVEGVDGIIGGVPIERDAGSDTMTRRWRQQHGGEKQAATT